MLRSFDFEVAAEECGPPWFATLALEPFCIVAGRGSGCIYALTGSDGHILFVGSEGKAGIVAGSLEECLQLVIWRPYWEDALRSSGGDLDTLRRLLGADADKYEDELLVDHPEIEDFRPILQQTLELRPPTDPAQYLLHALSSIGSEISLKVIAPDGQAAAPLLSRQ